MGTAPDLASLLDRPSAPNLIEAAEEEHSSGLAELKQRIHHKLIHVFQRAEMRQCAMPQFAAIGNDDNFVGHFHHLPFRFDHQPATGRDTRWG